MQKVFITGGAGFIGSRVVREFLAVNFDVTVFDSFKQYVAPDPRAKPVNLLARLADVSDDISLVTGDTLNKDFLRRTLNRARPNVIVHMAALPLANVAIEQTEEAFDSILSSTVNILEVVRDFDHECPVIYTSSSMVYGDFQTPSVTETAPKDPKDIYGRSSSPGRSSAPATANATGSTCALSAPRPSTAPVMPTSASCTSSSPVRCVARR